MRYGLLLFERRYLGKSFVESSHINRNLSESLVNLNMTTVA